MDKPTHLLSTDHRVVESRAVSSSMDSPMDFHRIMQDSSLVQLYRNASLPECFNVITLEPSGETFASTVQERMNNSRGPESIATGGASKGYTVSEFENETIEDDRLYEHLTRRAREKGWMVDYSCLKKSPWWRALKDHQPSLLRSDR